MEEGEGLHLDFKFEVSDASKIARSLVSFANTLGGKLLIGVNDDGTISGIRSAEELFMIEKAALEYCKPPVNFVSREWRLKGKVVLVVSIAPSLSTPHKAPDHAGAFKAFVRIDDQNMLANGIQMKIWNKQNEMNDINFVYSDEARIMLSMFDDTEFLTLENVLSVVKLSKFNIENILAELILMKVLNMSVSTDKVLFSLMDPEE
ncbi:MAG: ATP-binding protein [Bacteroidota bacterium]